LGLDIDVLAAGASRIPPESGDAPATIAAATTIAATVRRAVACARLRQAAAMPKVRPEPPGRGVTRESSATR
jgi:hypothetical protein